MVKKLLSVFMLGACVLSAHAQYQLANGDFEEWETVTSGNKSGEEPKKWSSFLDGTGSMKSMAAAVQMVKSTEKPSSSTGHFSAKIYARSVFGVVAQGNLTNGCINMGSTTATDASGNYNYINEGREDQAMKLSGHPDAMKVWIKYKGNDATYNKGNVSVLLTTKGYYQDPYANASKITATLVAKANNPEIVSNDNWTEYTIPFTYLTEDAPYYSLITFSTCATPGKGNKNDYMFVDDAVMLYYSDLKTASYDGAEITFNGTSASVDAVYDESKLQLTSNGKAATIKKNYDSKTALLTITVEGENISEDADNKHIYTIQFATAIDLEISAQEKYATFCAPFDVTVPAGVVASTATLNGETVKLTSVGNSIPANTPVVLYAANGLSKCSVAGLAAPAADLTEGCLTGVYRNVQASVGCYVLQNHAGKVGFYQVAAGTQPTIKANHAYLTAPSDARFIGFDGEETGVVMVNESTSQQDNKTYNLAGQRVSKAEKGIFIINGKKVLK